MATAKPRRTQVDALDDLRAEMRLSNVLQALSMGPTAWEHDTTTRATTDTAVARLKQRNALRAEVRAAMPELKEKTDGD